MSGEGFSYEESFCPFQAFGLEEDVLLALVGDDVNVCGVCDVFDLVPNFEGRLLGLQMQWKLSLTSMEWNSNAMEVPFRHLLEWNFHCNKLCNGS